MIETPFTKAFGIDCPIAQAPMGGSVTADLICAVCEAGGLGMQGVSWHEPAAMVAEIRAAADPEAGAVGATAAAHRLPDRGEDAAGLAG